MDKGRWVVRIASLTILMGFFLPSVMVSCSGGFVDASQSFSLADIASYLEQSAIYLLPIAAVAAGILTFIPGKRCLPKRAYSIWADRCSGSGID